WNCLRKISGKYAAYRCVSGTTISVNSPFAASIVTSVLSLAASGVVDTGSAAASREPAKAIIKHKQARVGRIIGIADVNFGGRSLGAAAARGCFGNEVRMR